MSKFPREEERDRVKTALSDKTKPDHIHLSHGPLSSLKAVLKRTKSNCQSKHRGGNHKRRPEITVLSAEPFDCGKAGPLVPPAPCPAPPQSFHQVQEKPKSISKPVAPPRRLNCVTSNPTTLATNPTKAAGKRPPKPPRPSAPKNRKTASADQTNADVKSTPPCDNQDGGSKLASCSLTNCSRSVTVYWNNTTSPDTSTATTSIQPVPLPRIKSKRPLILQKESHALVQLDEKSNCSDCGVDSFSSSKYLAELLEVFSAGSVDVLNQSRASVEDAGEMSGTNSFRARIQAFESQSDETPKPSKPQPKARTKPLVASKPSLAARQQSSTDDLYEEVYYSYPTPAPEPANKPEDNSVKEELTAILAQHRSMPPKLTRDDSIYVEEGSVKAPPTPPRKPVKEPLRPNLNINNHNNYTVQPLYEDAETIPTEEGPGNPEDNEYDVPDSTYADSASQLPEHTESEYEFVEYAPSMRKEPDYGFVDNKDEDKPSNLPPKPQPSNTNFQRARQSFTKRPTTIIVPSKSVSFSDDFQDRGPPLPAQRPVGTLKQSQRHSIASFPPQASSSAAPEPALPPRRLTTRKSLPQRPVSMAAAPDSPILPRVEAHPNPGPPDTSLRPQPPKPQKKGPLLPPRPNPGHQLYNKYTLQVPHAVASSDYNSGVMGELSFQKDEVLMLVNAIDPNTYECQVGDKRGRVQRSSMKVITPLSAASQDAPLQAGRPTGSGSELTVKVLHDFSPENPGELYIKAGDVVTQVEQLDDEWYRGKCRGSSGYFPINYVKVLNDSPPLPGRPGVKPSATISGPRCVATFDFAGEHSDELSFSKGDVIQLKAYVGQDWARGQLGTLSGIFPLNFVEIVQDLPPAPDQQQQTQPSRIALPGMSQSAHAAGTPPVQPGAEWVVALYDFSGKTGGDLSFEKGDRILITKHLSQEWSRGRLNGREGIFPRAFVESKTDQVSSADQNSGAAGGVRAKALFDFEPDSEEELSIKIGDVITNVESVDDEWYLGDLRGRRALVPKNYLQIL